MLPQHWPRPQVTQVTEEETLHVPGQRRDWPVLRKFPGPCSSSPRVRKAKGKTGRRAAEVTEATGPRFMRPEFRPIQPRSDPRRGMTPVPSYVTTGNAKQGEHESAGPEGLGARVGAGARWAGRGQRQLGIPSPTPGEASVGSPEATLKPSPCPAPAASPSHWDWGRQRRFSNQRHLDRTPGDGRRDRRHPMARAQSSERVGRVPGPPGPTAPPRAAQPTSPGAGGPPSGLPRDPWARSHPLQPGPEGGQGWDGVLGRPLRCSPQVA